jgi:hypothetical protein
MTFQSTVAGGDGIIHAYTDDPRTGGYSSAAASGLLSSTTWALNFCINMRGISPFSGYSDKFYLFNRILSTTEIQEMFNEVVKDDIRAWLWMNDQELANSGPCTAYISTNNGILAADTMHDLPNAISITVDHNISAIFPPCFIQPYFGFSFWVNLANSAQQAVGLCYFIDIGPHRIYVYPAESGSHTLGIRFIDQLDAEHVISLSIQRNNWTYIAFGENTTTHVPFDCVNGVSTDIGSSLTIGLKQLYDNTTIAFGTSGASQSCVGLEILVADFQIWNKPYTVANCLAAFQAGFGRSVPVTMLSVVNNGIMDIPYDSGVCNITNFISNNIISARDPFGQFAAFNFGYGNNLSFAFSGCITANYFGFSLWIKVLTITPTTYNLVTTSLNNISISFSRAPNDGDAILFQYSLNGLTDSFWFSRQQWVYIAFGLESPTKTPYLCINGISTSKLSVFSTTIRQPPVNSTLTLGCLSGCTQGGDGQFSIYDFQLWDKEYTPYECVTTYNAYLNQ